MPKSVLEVGLLPDNRVGVRQTRCDADRYSVVKTLVSLALHAVFAHSVRVEGPTC